VVFPPNTPEKVILTDPKLKMASISPRLPEVLDVKRKKQKVFSLEREKTNFKNQ
jgi:hypothetical protein